MRKIKTNNWNNNNNNKKDRIETIADPDDNTSYYCKYCNFTMIQLDEISYYCNRCMCEQFPDKEDNKRKTKLITPNQNTETLISSIPSGYENYKLKKKVELKGGFKSLAEKGLKITNYRVTDGAGRPIYEDEG